MTTYYTKDHEWVSIDGDTATVGITNYAQEQLGDIVFVELPETDDELAAGDEACVVESVKAAGDVHSPVSGVVTMINERLEDAPEKVNSEAETKGWLYKIQLSNNTELDELMNEEAYKDFIAE